MTNRNELVWWVYAVELDSAGEALETIRRRSPNWNENLPQVFISMCSEDPRIRFANGFEASSKKEVRDDGIGLRPDILLKGGLSEEVAFRALTEHNRRLREQGYGLLNTKPRRSCRVYVIDLDPAVREKRREVRKANPDADPNMPCVYVGQTGLPIKKRRAQHRKGIKAGRRYVTDYGFRRPFLTDLFEHLNPCLPEDALRYERELAEELRAQGYTVCGGH